ncbi:hypothetical protein CDAR_471201 [Caerostris darwini]|uniref:Uncharacterized protein n=1 Tax=Caerostris darwini TaxID=1538125 RepID=A0AAV4QRL3_9ARAC|nr:hypothetical protein CDAR_471201 [Caerostris darwini]
MDPWEEPQTSIQLLQKRTSYETFSQVGRLFIQQFLGQKTQYVSLDFSPIPLKQASHCTYEPTSCSHPIKNSWRKERECPTELSCGVLCKKEEMLLRDFFFFLLFWP